jgi:hypothetical protein
MRGWVTTSNGRNCINLAHVSRLTIREHCDKDKPKYELLAVMNEAGGVLYLSLYSSSNLEYVQSFMYGVTEIGGG